MADLIARARRRGPRAEASAVPDAVVGMQSPAHGGNPVAKRTARQRSRRRRCVHQEPDGSPRAAGPRRRASGRAAKATAAAVPHAYIGPPSRSCGGPPPRGANALWRPLTVGLVHGLAGSGALPAIAFAELPGCRIAAPRHDPSGAGRPGIDRRNGDRIGRGRGRAARHPAVGRRAPRQGSGSPAAARSPSVGWGRSRCGRRAAGRCRAVLTSRRSGSLPPARARCCTR